MPTTVVDEPLGIACVFSDGRRAEFDLDGLPNPRLARDLAGALVELVHPHGSADSAGTVAGYLRALRKMGTRSPTRGSPAARHNCGAGSWPSPGWRDRPGWRR